MPQQVLVHNLKSKLLFHANPSPQSDLVSCHVYAFKDFSVSTSSNLQQPSTLIPSTFWVKLTTTWPAQVTLPHYSVGAGISLPLQRYFTLLLHIHHPVLTSCPRWKKNKTKKAQRDILLYVLKKCLNHRNQKSVIRNRLEMAVLDFKFLACARFLIQNAKAEL